ncbi:MAG: chloride channel protein [Candidatus Latescibacteria bacterium]|nr:chloride channel protein [Candidatus Latescibacterota bacterium]
MRAMKPRASEDQLADFTRDRRVLVLSLMAFAIGIISALVAYALIWLINVITHLSFYQDFSSAPVSPAGHHLHYWVVLVPVIGGLLIGLMARYGSEKIRGHGIPEALEAILFGQSRMHPKVAILKPLSSAISIGTGGPFGAEGPIIMTGGACGSLFAQLFHLSAAERKTLLVAGAAGGMSAIFASPVAAVLLAVELLLFEWKPRSFIPVAIAAAVAGAMRVALLGSGPIFPVLPHAALDGEGLALAFSVGIVAGLGSGLLTTLVYAFEDLFQKLPIHWAWWPAIGGLCIGIGGLIDPRVLGVGYDMIHALLNGQLVGASALSLLVVKALVWSVALGSGTSGGVLAPLLIMGGALGAVESQWIPIGDAGLWSMISMAAMMGGTMRSPLTSIIFTLELTHDLNVMPALLVGSVAAHGVTVLLLRRSILTEKVARRGYHITREYAIDPLEQLRVGEVCDRDAPTVSQATTLGEFSDLLAQSDAPLTRHQGTLIVDGQGFLVGLLTRGDLMRGLQEDEGRTVLDAGSRELIVTYPDEVLRQAVEKMVSNDIGRLPVVNRANPREIIGYLGRSNVFAARRRHLEEEHVREPGWLTSSKARSA